MSSKHHYQDGQCQLISKVSTECNIHPSWKPIWNSTWYTTAGTQNKNKKFIRLKTFYKAESNLCTLINTKSKQDDKTD